MDHPDAAAAAPVPAIPERPGLEDIEERWDAVWEERGTYRFDRTRERSEVFSIDTPPPTVSGSCLLYTSPSPRDKRQSRMPSSA